MKCPYCGCRRFYTKDPADEFETYALDCESGEACYDPEVDAETAPALSDDAPIHCEKCAWKGKLGEIKG